MRFFGLLLLVALTSCDWNHYHMMNTIPFEGTESDGKTFHVYLGIDGLSHRSVLEAQAQGAFGGPTWRLAKFITMFPGTSDASWTRILHTDPIPGYEFEHYDAPADQIHNTGFLGYICHALPHLSTDLNFEPQFYSAFDYRANGYLHTVGSYLNTFSNLSESMDNFFTLLDGRVRTGNAFSGYLLEMDVMGHMQSPQEITSALVRLSRRIVEFKKRYPGKNIQFTIFSDHGMDFIPVSRERLVKFDDEMRAVGVVPVDSVRGRDPSRETFAVTIMHTRVTYLELHTAASLVKTVAERVSQIPAVDVAISRVEAEAIPEVHRSSAKEWFAVWEKGKAILTFGFDPISDRYVSLPGAAWERLGLPLGKTDAPTVYSDDEAFKLTSHARYPDIFYRVRTALSPVAVKYPASVIVSLKGGFASMGQEMPAGASDMAMSAFHGALDAPGTVGTLLTEERDLPPAVRSDNFLELFPQMTEHMVRRGVRLTPGDAYAPIQY